MLNTESTITPRILVVDDNHSIHEDFRKILIGNNDGDDTLDEMEATLFGAKNTHKSTLQYTVDFASQGRDALEKVIEAEANGEPYSVAFIDGRMPPGWDGIKTTKKIWEKSPKMQVVLCTAYADYSWSEIQQSLGETNNLVILKKPFDNVEVLQMAHALSRKWELSQQIEGRLHQLAYYDSLTGLPNREHFLRYLKYSLEFRVSQPWLTKAG